ncbi:hypothetical protein PQC55_gp101 [Escherichia phage vB_EcoP-CHD5UKE1]|uniref:Uncharacterized protein n=2 Tax=Kuravirus SU10 TaxID=1987942 RepID=A0A0B4N285_9CAUD|nr:hypothetical protein ACQ52_gp097 [Escherichia phage vB_EcoP_SU10]YP_010674007.1 hypothetical protein PQC55_gp101 [Escherichia phage vB_EcoP-CHD5UKE1]AIF71849.1 hypothetical protein SU10_097 [Escherichia phage vB_EcoP_SU10]QZI80597.1 hypothetical protein CHD5UKE1_101 [Escherichia phage vB_EcoP-CHD5UKE1]
MKIIPKIKDNTVSLATIIPGNPFVIQRGTASPQYYIRVNNVSNKISVEDGWITTVNLLTGVLGVMKSDAPVEVIRMSVVQE